MDKLDQGTPSCDFSNTLKILFNQFNNSSKARDQALERGIKSTMDAELKVLRTQLKNVTEEKNHLSQAGESYQETIAKLAGEKAQLTDQNIQLTADKTQLVAENNQLAAQKARLIAEFSEMETNNDRLTKASIKAEKEKKELLEKIDHQEKLMEEDHKNLTYTILQKDIQLKESHVLTNHLSAKLAAKENEEKNEREKLQESINELFNKKKN